MRPIIWSHRIVPSVCLCVVCLSFLYQGHAVAAEPNLITGSVQNQDLRRVDQAIVQVRDQEGTVVAQGVTNQAGEFSVLVSQEGTYSVSAIHETYRSEYVVVKVGTDKPASGHPDVGPDARHRARNCVAAASHPIQGLERDVFREPEGY